MIKSRISNKFYFQMNFYNIVKSFAHQKRKTYLQNNNIFNASKRLAHQNLKTNLPNNLFLMEDLKKNILTYEYKKYTLNKVITISPLENQIFSFITTVVDKYKLGTICRVAGGWVRDKLLGRESDDIDITLDNLTGEQLAKCINAELNGEEVKYHIIKQNNDKSKHLETATIKIFGTPIDLVNLRSEKYSNNSRVPEITIGEPKEDSLRRDLTINSLFYNINTGLIEDFTEKGIFDLSNGIIRTPIDPFQTFLDDPLRILRVVRFTTRFQFSIEDEIEKSIKNEEIKSALYKKVSNERIHKELELMFEGNKPQCAIYILYKFDILDNILKLPLSDQINDLKNPIIVNSNLISVVNLSAVAGVVIERYIQNNLNDKNFIFFGKEVYEDKFSAKFSKNLFFNVLAFPFRKYHIKVKKTSVTGSEIIISESLKLSKDSIKEIETISLYYDEFKRIVLGKSFDRLIIGMLIRNITLKLLSQFYIIGICDDYCEIFALNRQKNDNQTELIESVDINLLEQVVEKYRIFTNYIIKENLRDVENLKPILRGDQIQSIVQVKGSNTRKYVDFVLHQQIMNPNITEESMIKLVTESKNYIK